MSDRDERSKWPQRTVDGRRGRLRLLFWRHGDHLEATAEGSHPEQSALLRLKAFLIGKPLANRDLPNERLPKFKALAIFASDALSSVAYATQEALTVLVLAGTAALSYMLPIAIAIVVLLALVAFSYRQTIFHYPQGGGTYTVTQDNLGALPALIAGGSLMIDYVLTVAVSIAAGIAAITSAEPSLEPWSRWLALGMIVLLTLVNLRGVRASATIFALPTYLFLASMLGLIGVAAWQVFTGQPPVEHVAAGPRPPVEALGLFLVLRAFASGCSAMTGTEAISNGIPAFREPQSRNAATTLLWMAALLAGLFLGLSLLALHYGIAPSPQETVVSQIARAVVGHGWLYDVVQASTAAILLLAANTSYSDFPRLAHFMAQDGYLPRRFALRGDRLAYSDGIVFLAAFAMLLIAIFGANTHALIPLYAIGVFVAFTLSQSGMARRWWTRREPGWRQGLAINALGAIATGIVSVVVISTKFTHGGWVVAGVLPLLVWFFLHTHRAQQAHQREQSATPSEIKAHPLAISCVLVPIARLDRPAVRAMRLARALGKNVTAVHVTDDVNAGRALRALWKKELPEVPFELLESPYRATAGPLVAYVKTLGADADHPVLVLLSSSMPTSLWDYMLSNYQSWKLRLTLYFLPEVVVMDAPYAP